MQPVSGAVLRSGVAEVATVDGREVALLGRPSCRVRTCTAVAIREDATRRLRCCVAFFAESNGWEAFCDGGQSRGRQPMDIGLRRELPDCQGLAAACFT